MEKLKMSCAKTNIQSLKALLCMRSRNPGTETLADECREAGSMILFLDRLVTGAARRLWSFMSSAGTAQSDSVVLVF
jgi:hypothetical protein